MKENNSPYSSAQPYDPIKKRFINPHIKDEKRTLKDAILWKMGYFNDKADLPQMPSYFSPTLPKEPAVDSSPRALWINHSTFFLKIEGVHFLTDPIWGKRCSPVNFFGPIRRHSPGLELQELGHVDHVLISHDHYDHLDKQTVLELHRLYPTIRWWVPLGVKKWFLNLGIMLVEELGWWESLDFTSPTDPSLQLTFTAVPTQHFSGRTIKDRWTTLWVGWVVDILGKELSKRLYFVGDTGYNEVDFKAIGQRWPHMDLSLIPIGSYVPRKFMSPVHIDPWQAVQIHKEVGSKQSIGMHWRTFKLSDEGAFRPPYDLSVALQKEGINPMHFLAIPPGHEINW